MAYSRQDIVEWVMTRMDELAPSEQDAVLPQSAIERELDEAANVIISLAPKHLLIPIATDLKTRSCIIRTLSYSNFSIVIPIETTFLRLMRLHLHNWNTVCENLTPCDSSVYLREYNLYQKTDANRPVVGIIPFSSSLGEGDAAVTYTQALEAFPIPSVLSGDDCAYEIDEHGVVNNDDPAAGLYPLIQELSVVTEKAVESLPSKLVDAAVWNAAGKCLSALRQYDPAKIAFDNYTAAMNQLRA